MKKIQYLLFLLDFSQQPGYLNELNVHHNFNHLTTVTGIQPLSILFNISFASGQLPQDWKLVNVVPVHKKGDKADIENYRPISLTSLVMKVMEKIVRDELYSKFQDLISDKQYGFLPICHVLDK